MQLETEGKYMKRWKYFITISCLLIFNIYCQNVDAQQNLAQQAYAIFEQSCLICHGENGAHRETLIIEHTSLIADGKVIPGDPDGSVFYQRLIETNPALRMPQGQPPLDPAAIKTIEQWILAGAPDWDAGPRPETDFITTDVMLQTIENHVNSLSSRDRSFARYFTLTHLYNAGDTTETLNAYRRGLSKLINSLSWGREVVRPMPIDAEETIYYIDLRDYEWDVRNDAWTLIEEAYPYKMTFDAPTQTDLREKLTILQQQMNCEVPFVYVDWFLATASLPPLYHDILALPQTDRELEEALDVFVADNLQNAPGKRVWRAGFNESGVSRHNRVVERHSSSYGAYWKSYDFGGSADIQNIFTHPIDFTHDGGEIIFNLPNGLQAYFLVDGEGNRLDEAPISIVSYPGPGDPTVRNGLSCIGCHTQGMKTFEDEVRAVVEQAVNPPFNRARALELYVEQEVMNALVDEDTLRYRNALEAAGGVFGGIEPIQRFHEVFQGPLDAAYVAAVVGLETDIFLEKISKRVDLQNLLGALVLEGGRMKRDTWTSNFDAVIDALNTGGIEPPPVGVYIPDPNLHAAISVALGKGETSMNTISHAEIATLTTLRASDRDIKDLTGLEHAINLVDLHAFDNQITDLSPLSKLINLKVLSIYNNPIDSLSPIAGLVNLESLLIVGDKISDISPLAGLTKLRHFFSWGNPISDLSPLIGLTELNTLDICGADIPDLSPLAKLSGLKNLYLASNGISDISSLSKLTSLTRLNLERNKISDVSPLADLTQLKWLGLHYNLITDFSHLSELSETTISRTFNPGAPTGGAKIEGPWLWTIVPAEHLDSTTDLLSEASEDVLTEQHIATYGANSEIPVGDNMWITGKIAPSGQKNITDMLDTLGIETVPNVNDRIIYGSIILNSPREQYKDMFVGSNTAVKIWLNGELVYQNLNWNNTGVHNYHDFFSTTLKLGANVLLVAVDYRPWLGWNGFFGFEEGTEYTVTPHGSGFTFSASEAHLLAGDGFTLNLNAENITDLAGWQADIEFDPNVLEAVEVNEGDFLKSDGASTFFQSGTIDNAAGKITGLSSARIAEKGVSGTGTVLSVMFMAKTGGETQVTLENFEFGSITGDIIPTVPVDITITVGEYPAWDVNQDGRVSILDLILVARDFGAGTPANLRTDVNRDGVINIQDLITDLPPVFAYEY
ncbi:hypothetical protein C6497_04485 [Candidatus Poribacteria bacterium]|nr:MAG: hypothetical protein C6497_04485 [Candidatus Poribacteria bacterium]